MRILLRACGCLLAAVVVAPLTLAPAGAAEGPTKHVLIVHGGPEDFPGNSDLDAVLRKGLFSHPKTPVVAYSEYLENEEFLETAYTSLRDYIRLKFHDVRADLVIANTAPALQFVLRSRDELFPGVPVLFVAATLPPEVLRGEVAGVTGLVRNPSHAETVDMALKIHPATTRLHVVAYAPDVDGFQQRVRATLAAFSNRVELTFSNEPSLPEMLNTVRKLPADSLLFFVRYSPATTGRVIFPSERLPAILEAAPVPVYGSLDTNIGKGVVGGMMRSNVAEATRLGEMALRILEGEAPQNIPVEASAVRPVFDWVQLQRWGIDESRLPEGSDIRNRVPTVWELYGAYIVATIVALIALILLIAELLRQRAGLQDAGRMIQAREASLRTSYGRIRNMAGRLIRAQEAARADIARDLHDDVCQKLASISAGIDSLRSAAGNIQDPQTHQVIEELERDTQSTFDSIHQLSHDLHPATLRLLGLAPALRSHCDEVTKRQGVELRFSSTEDLGSVHPDMAVCFFRIAQESLRNGIEHGGAKHLSVTLARSEDALEMTVADDGCGFDVSAVKSNGGGLGLVTMEERAHVMCGDLSIVSEIARGTTIRVRVPAEPTAAKG